MFQSQKMIIVYVTAGAEATKIRSPTCIGNSCDCVLIGKSSPKLCQVRDTDYYADSSCTMDRYFRDELRASFKSMSTICGATDRPSSFKIELNIFLQVDRYRIVVNI